MKKELCDGTFVYLQFKSLMEKYNIKSYLTQLTPRVSLLSSTVYRRKATKYCTFCAILLVAISCNSSRNIISSGAKNNQWKIVKTDKNDTPSWIIYTRKITGTNFLEYKIEGDIKSSPKSCVSSFRQDIHNQADDVDNKKYPTYQIVDESKDSILTYVIHNEPFPLKDTEMSVRYIFYDNPGSMGVRWTEAWSDSSVQLSKKLNRIETFRGHWNFSPTVSDSCKAINSVSFDPKKMPLWLVEPMVFKFLKKGLEYLRETTTKP